MQIVNSHKKNDVPSWHGNTRDPSTGRIEDLMFDQTMEIKTTDSGE